MYRIVHYKVKANWRTISQFISFGLVSLLVVLGVPNLLSNSGKISSLDSLQAANIADAVIDWNNTAIATTQGITAPLQVRALSITHAAIFDAVNAIDRRYNPYAIDTTAPVGTSADAAVASAGYTVLTKLYPAQKENLDKALQASLKKIPDGRAENDGVKLGKEVAEKILAIRSKDGWDAKVDYKPATGASAWQPTPPAYAPAALPQFSNITPFTFQNKDQFQVPAPLAVTSAEYAKDINEVKAIGGRNSKVRSADQTAVAIFWTINTPVLWNAAARSAAIAKGNSLTENARLFALLNFAITDAYIAGYGVKYKYNFLRPVTAIRNADALGNPAITAAPNWEPLIITPAHPDYISGHSVTSGAAEKILQKFFNSDDVKLSFTFPAGAVTRYYSSFSQISKENENARVWGGIHTRTADVQGTKLGYQIAENAFNSNLKPL